MCFSATASFSAGAVLTVIGIASIKKIHHPSHILFASIPFIFGIQQLAEGLLWISLPNPDWVKSQQFATYTFLLLAQVIWPIWVPISILLLEKSNKRKIIQKILLGAGLIAGIYLGYCLMEYPVEGKIIGHHISYQLGYPATLRYYIIVLYAFATISTPFFSSIKYMWLIGVLVLISYVITFIFYDQYFISVWCFFSSILSISIYLIMLEISKSKNNHNNFYSLRLM